MTETATKPRQRTFLPEHPAMAKIKLEQSVLRKLLKAVIGVDPSAALSALDRAADAVRLETLPEGLETPDGC